MKSAQIRSVFCEYSKWLLVSDWVLNASLILNRNYFVEFGMDLKELNTLLLSDGVLLI